MSCFGGPPGWPGGPAAWSVPIALGPRGEARTKGGRRPDQKDGGAWIKRWRRSDQKGAEPKPKGAELGSQRWRRPCQKGAEPGSKDGGACNKRRGARAKKGAGPKSKGGGARAKGAARKKIFLFFFLHFYQSPPCFPGIRGRKPVILWPFGKRASKNRHCGKN